MQNTIPFRIPASLKPTKKPTDQRKLPLPLTIAQCKVKFLNYKLKVNKRSVNTVKAYVGEIDRLSRVLPKGPLTLITEVTAEMIDTYIAYANTEKRKWEDHPFNANSQVSQVGLKGTTVNNMRRYLAVFFNWLVSEGIITESPVAHIEKVTEDEVSYGAILEPFELQHFLTQIRIRVKAKNPRRSFNSYVDATLIQVLVDTAMRIGQCLQLKVDDLLLDQCLIHIRPEITKTHVERWVAITEGTANMLKNVVKGIEEITEAGVPWLWLTPEGTHLAYSTVVDRLKRHAELTGLDPERVRPHQFRHYSAIQHRKNGATVDQIQVLLEHKSIETTMIYLKRFKHDLRQINDRYSPAHDLIQKPGRKSGAHKITLPEHAEFFYSSNVV